MKIRIVALAWMALAAFAQRVEFSQDIAPLLQGQCLRCHGSGRVNLSSRDAMIASKVLNPGKPDDSALYLSVASGSMPPTGKLKAEDIGKLRTWIEYGAQWSETSSLSASSSAQAAAGTSKATEMENVGRIRRRILEKAAASGSHAGKVTIPNTTVSFEMIPVPAGDFIMGSNKKEEEQPPHRVHVDAFAMQAHEVTWDEYRLFMFANQAGETTHKDEVVDATSRPTRPYVEMSFGMGINGYPAISMTQHAANKYAEWLSSRTGQFYRLPTEAEWEYACHAGTNGESYGSSDSGRLGDYAVFAGNAGGRYSRVASKRPNPWGLYDMLGNVMEWTLDGYQPYVAGAADNPWMKAAKPYPHAVRGGSWNDAADRLTCTSRVASDPAWKRQDPQLPKSIWYLTDAQWLGFRLVRPAKVPPAGEMFRYWNSGVEHDEQ